MRKLISVVVLLSLLFTSQTALAAKDQFILKAGLGSWGSSIKIHDCSVAENSWVRFAAEVSNTGNPVAFQARSNRNWQTVGSGQTIQGKSVRLRGMSATTAVDDDGSMRTRFSSGAGDFVTIRVTTSCIDDQ